VFVLDNAINMTEKEVVDSYLDRTVDGTTGIDKKSLLYDDYVVQKTKHDAEGKTLAEGSLLI